MAVRRCVVATNSALRRIQLGNALSAFGSGFTVPFLFVYVTRVRDMSAGQAGLMFSVLAVAALAALPLIGPAIDRRGPRPVAVAGAVVAAAGSLTLGLAVNAPLVMIGAALLGAGVAGIQPALATMIVRCTTPATRARAFALQFTFNNLGLGIGGLIGGLIVDPAHPASFTVLFAMETVMFLVLGLVVGTAAVPAAEHAAAGAGAKSGWRHLLRNKAMVRLCAVSALIFFTCYGQFESGLAAFATEVSRISPSMLGVALAANTAVIVVGQLAVLKITARRRRSMVIAATGLVWLLAWIVTAVSGLVHGNAAMAVLTIIGAYALLGVGESLLAPTLGPMVADLAPAHLLGQYNAAQSLVKQLAMAAGPAFAGLMVGSGAYGPYLVALMACSLLITVLGVRMGRKLSPVQNGVVVAASLPVEPHAGLPSGPQAEPAAVVRPRDAAARPVLAG
ncbi:MFS transporter [Yinghuangia soli]|uniref:MFS transporter n=1 Tax=Yinghuangia soli TaxID=2908204 RepID=A0AA41PW51_9ACTN|nr:MFS transporter [Yinghuangia soli]MCF2526811.1 MFS transporter [Yinghuangia soli]